MNRNVFYLSTSGRQLYGTVGEIYEANKHQSNIHYLDKTRYDSFFGTCIL
jgi:hypothetical protein